MKKLTNTFIQKGARACFALLFSVLLMPMLFAQSVWTGNAGTTNWNTPGNWTGGVPAAGKTVIIYQCTTCPVINTMGNEASFVQVYAGGKLTIGTGSLRISNPGGPGMKTQTNSVVNVSTGASLTIQNFWGEGLSVQGAFNNNGTTTINGGHTGVAVASGGAFANGPTGSLSISGSTLNYGLVVEGSFNNQNILSIDDANNDGIHVKTGTTLNLGGTVSITRTGVNAIYTRSTVNLSGNLTIDNALNGIYLLNATFNNGATGKLTIGGSTFLNNGIYIDPGTFNNNGELTINQAISKGMEISSASTFNNFNKLTLNVPAWAGIFNVGGSNFTNKPCALIESNAAIVNYAMFTNNGIIKAPNGSGTSINVNNGTLLGNFQVGSGNAAVTIPNAIVWTGCAGTDWNNANNWMPAIVPTYTSSSIAVVQKVTLASGNAPMPTNGNFGAGRLILDKNATMTVGTGARLLITYPYPGGGQLEILQGATLNVQYNSELNTINTIINGTLLNAGFITPPPTVVSGSFNMSGGTFTNQATGVCGFGEDVLHNLSNASNFTNSGTIFADGTGGFKLNQSNLTNTATGHIYIGNSTVSSFGIENNSGTVNNAGNILNAAALTNNGTCINSGQWNNNKGIVNNSSFTNSNVLRAGGNTGLVNGNLATFKNEAAGQLLINNVFRGISMGGTLNNYGLISIDGTTDVGIVTYQGSFNNALGATVNLSHTQMQSFFVYGHLQNSGTINITDVQNSTLVVSGTCTNTATGVVNTKHSGNGVVSFGSLTNFGNFNIENSSTRGLETGAVGSIFNEVGGKVSINGTGTEGVAVFVKLVNKGEIKVWNAGTTGFANAGGLLETFPGSHFETATGHGDGIVNWGTIKNQGRLVAVYNAGNGIVNLGNSIENSAIGHIVASGVNDIVNRAPFHNFGLIDALDSNGNGILNEPPGIFNNRPCAEIIMSGSRINNSGTFNNQGLLRISFPSPCINMGSFVNTGVLEDPLNTFDGVNITNNAFRIRPISGTVGSVIYNAVEAGGVPPITIGSTWYKDPNLTQSAGTFNSVLNTFTPTLGVGTHSLYFTVKDIVNNCTKTVSVKVTITSALIGFGEKAKPDIVLFNYPNPFVDETRIKLSLPFDATGKLVIYDHFGRLVEVVYEGELAEGELYEFGFDASRLGVANYLATLVLDDGRSFTARLVKSDNW